MKHAMRALALTLTLCLLLPACSPSDETGEDPTDIGVSVTDVTPETGEPDSTPAQPETSAPDTQPEETEPETQAETEDEAMKAQRMIDELTASPYAASAPEGYGLTAPVGADQGRLENEVLYPAPADADCSKVVYLADYGMGPDKSGAENFAALTEGLAVLKGADGIKKAVLPAGTLRLSQTIPFGGYHDLYVVGSPEGTTILMEVWSSLLYARDNDGIHINDVTLNYLHSPIVAGSVSGWDMAAGIITVTVDEAFDLSAPEYGLSADKTRGLSGYYELGGSAEVGYFLTTDKLVRYGAGDACRLSASGSNTVDVIFTGGALSQEPVKGARVNLIFPQYDACGLNFTFNKNVYLEHVTLSETTGMGLVITYSENAYVNHLDILPDRAHGLVMGSSADGIHTIRLAGDFKLTNSTLCGTQDDCLNVCSTYDRVASFSGSTLVFTPVGETTGICPGHTIEIWDPAAWTLYGTYTVVGVDGTSLTLDRDVQDGVREGFVIGNVSTATRLTIDNCVFTASMGRGGLIQSRETAITGCTFSDLVYPALRIHAVNDQFKEGIVPADITVTGCKMVNCNQFPFYDSMIEVMAYDTDTFLSSPGAIRNVTIENNLFAHTPGNAVSLCGVGDASVRHNLMADLLNKPLYTSRVTIGNMMMNAAVGIAYTKNAAVSDNFVWMPLTVNEYVDVLCREGTTESVTEENNTSLRGARGVFASLSTDFSEKQGEGNFYYKKRASNGKMMNLTWNRGDGRWQESGSFCIIGRAMMHPDKMDPALVYKVPQSGTWEYYYSVQPVESQSDGVGVAVLVNGEFVVRGEGDSEYVYVSPLFVCSGTLTLELNEGDEVTLLVNKWDSNGHDTCNVKVRALLK